MFSKNYNHLKIKSKFRKLKYNFLEFLNLVEISCI
jgi:hypothetical protein